MRALMHQVEGRLAGLPVPVALRLPDGQRLGAAGATVTLSFQQWSGVARLAAGQIGGLAADYVENRVRFEGRMRDLMAVAARWAPDNPALTTASWWRRLAHLARSWLAHSPLRDAHQVRHHYDLGDGFYALWLDPMRVYSCAYWPQPGLTLAQAQQAKLELICRKLMLRPGVRLLDIGAGWGGLMLWAAEHYGVDATGITLSRNQHAHVQALIGARGLQGRVRMLLCDYRELQAQPFDRIASVGMFEHVGRARMPAYCAALARLSRPGGLVLNHGITAAGAGSTELGAGMGAFIEKYIFPGGELLHVSELQRHMADARLEVVDTENLRPHYARTLWAWSDALEARLDDARQALARTCGEQRADPVLRAYRLYLAGSAMSFEQGWIALHQLLATRPNGDGGTGELSGAQSEYPFTRDYIYRRGHRPCSTSSNQRPQAT